MKRYRWDDVTTTVRRNQWLRRRRLKLFSIQSSDRVLDVGCGDGLDIAVLRSLGVKHIVGLDISPTLLALARSRNPGVRFIRASATRIPVKSSSFEMVLGDAVFYRLCRDPRVIRELWRVLTSHGKLCFIEMHESWLRRAWDWVTAMTPLFLNRKKAMAAERDMITRWKTGENEFLRALPSFGFRKIFCRVDGLSIIGCFQKRSGMRAQYDAG